MTAGDQHSDGRRAEGPVSRRELLRWGLAAVAAVGIAGCAAPRSPRSAASVAPVWPGSVDPSRPLRQPGSMQPAPHPSTAGVTPSPAHLARPSPRSATHPQHPHQPPRGPATTRPRSAGPPAPAVRSAPPASPVYSLADYRARVGGVDPFPRDAVLLSIDDGPHPVWTPTILRLLERYDVTATFCVIGEQARQYPHLVRDIARAGHQLANHTFTHPLGLTTMPAAATRAQILDTQDAIVRAAGATPFQFRAPGGAWSPPILHATAAAGLIPIDWDIDPRDWSRPGTAHIITALLAAQPGDILLCHDGGGNRSQTYAALKTVLLRLKARGLRFVTLPAPHHLA